jgi:hypothetical protein
MQVMTRGIEIIVCLLWSNASVFPFGSIPMLGRTAGVSEWRVHSPGSEEPCKSCVQGSTAKLSQIGE